MYVGVFHDIKWHNVPLLSHKLNDTHEICDLCTIDFDAFVLRLFHFLSFYCLKMICVVNFELHNKNFNFFQLLQVDEIISDIFFHLCRILSFMLLRAGTKLMTKLIHQNNKIPIENFITTESWFSDKIKIKTMCIHY